MILKYKVLTPDYTYCSTKEMGYFSDVHTALRLFYEDMYQHPKDYNLPFDEPQPTPMVELQQAFLTLVPHVVESWNYLDNIKTFHVSKGFERGKGDALHVTVTLNTMEQVELALSNAVFLINDNGKTIEQLQKAKEIDYSGRERTLKVIDKYLNGKYNRGELFHQLNRIRIGEYDAENDVED